MNLEKPGNPKHLVECNRMKINELDTLLTNWSWVRVPVLVLLFNRFTLNGLGILKSAPIDTKPAV